MPSSELPIKPLSGLTILVTRPLNQAGPLINQLGQLGAKTLHQPGIKIAADFNTSQASVINTIQDFDWLIFISKNAVDYGLDLIEKTHRIKPYQQIAAIGKATAEALSARGFLNITSPGEGFNSEALLQLPEFSPAHVSGKKILIIRGGQGREYLKESLERADAAVTYLNVYRREKADVVLSTDDFKSVDIITVSSQEGLENFFSMLNAPSKELLLNKILITPGERCQQRAVELGFNHVETAANATDNAMLNCIITTINAGVAAHQ